MTKKEFKGLITPMQVVMIKGRLARMNRDPIGKLDELDHYILTEAFKWGNPRADAILGKRFIHLMMNRKTCQK